MRNAMLAMVALMAAGAATIAGPTPAAAIDYPYCIQGGGWGIRAIAPTGPMPNAWRPPPADASIATSILALHSASSAAAGTIGIIELRASSEEIGRHIRP
jgi:hypothetical protein